MELLDATSAGQVRVEDALNFYFADLAAMNSDKATSAETVILSSHHDVFVHSESLMPNLPETTPHGALAGIQRVRKRSVSDTPKSEEVLILLVLARLESVSTDVLISLTVPLQSLFSTPTPLDALPSIQELLLPSSDGQLTSFLSADFLSTLEAMRVFLRSWRVMDWSLFNG